MPGHSPKSSSCVRDAPSAALPRFVRKASRQPIFRYGVGDEQHRAHYVQADTVGHGVGDSTHEKANPYKETQFAPKPRVCSSVHGVAPKDGPVDGASETKARIQH